MDQTTKTILIVAGSILLVCACAAVAIAGTGLWTFRNFVSQAERDLSENPGADVRIGEEIAEFDVPAGFGSPWGAHFGDVSLVGYESESGSSHILFAQFPAGTEMNVTNLLKQVSLYPGKPENAWYKTEATLLEEQPVTVRGQESILSLFEGTASDGQTYRSAAVPFEGRGGPALLMVASPTEEWDLEMVEALIASIQ